MGRSLLRPNDNLFTPFLVHAKIRSQTRVESGSSFIPTENYLLIVTFAEFAVPGTGCSHEIQA